MKVTIYGKKGCKYCEKAVEHTLELIKQNKVESYVYIDIVEQNISKEKLSELLNKEINTVPQIVVDNKYVGGYTEYYVKYDID